MRNLKEMTVEELKKEIERLENWIFEEEMADFMNWNLYYKLRNQLREAKAELNSREWKFSIDKIKQVWYNKDTKKERKKKYEKE